jgi:hypothetical protein
MAESDESTTTDRLVVEVAAVFEPLVEIGEAAAEGNRAPLYRFCRSLGIDVDADGIEEHLAKIEECVTAFAEIWESSQHVFEIIQTIDGPGDPRQLEDIDDDVLESVDEGLLEELDSLELSVDELRDFAEVLPEAVDVIGELRDLSIATDDAEIESVGQTLLDYLIVDYLHRRQPSVADALTALDVITSEGGTPAVALDRIPEIIEDPQDALETGLEWGVEELQNQFDPFFVVDCVRRAE